MSNVIIRMLVPSDTVRNALKAKFEENFIVYHPRIEFQEKVIRAIIPTRFNRTTEIWTMQAKLKRLYEDFPEQFWFSIDTGKVVPTGSAGSDNWQQNIPRITNGNGSVPDYQWNRKVVRVDQAIEQLSDLNTGLKHKASGLRIFQFDTGASDHPDLANYPGYLSPANGALGEALSKNFVLGQNLNDSWDTLLSYNLSGPGFQKSGHGTATGFTIVGEEGVPQEEWPESPASYPFFDHIKTVNYGKGLFPYVEFVPIKISETVTLSSLNGAGNPNNLIKALDHVMANEGDIVTMSIGGEFGFDDAHKKIREAYNAGVIMVMAAGNAKLADNFVGVVKPAQFHETIAACGIEPKYNSRKRRILLEPWAQSCDGDNTDIAAPAKYICTTFKMNLSEIDDLEFKNFVNNGNAYKWGGATSQATAHVAAAAAIWKFRFRQELTAPEFQTDPWKIVESFRFALYASRHIPDHWGTTKKREYKGILDMEKLIHPLCSPDGTACKKFIEKIGANNFLANRFRVYKLAGGFRV